MQNKYGQLPEVIGQYEIEVEEMFFYQYLPIKLANKSELKFEDRLQCFEPLIAEAGFDFMREFGVENMRESYIYLTAKSLFITPDKPLNREGYHSDGFGTPDINYIWSNNTPTIFNHSEFDLSFDDRLSLIEMEQQAKPDREKTYLDNCLLRLNQYCIHKCGIATKPIVRTFVKISFSKDKYNLKGNSHNYLLDYSWDMVERKLERNIPQQFTQFCPSCKSGSKRSNLCPDGWHD